MEPESSPRKSDIPWYYRSPFFAGIYYAIGTSILSGVFLVPDFTLGRPGFVNGLMGFVVGALGGRLAGNFLVKDIRNKLPMNGVWWWTSIHVLRININQLFFSGLFFGAIIAAAALCYAVIKPLHFSWPWCGSGVSVVGGGVVSAFVAFIFSMGSKVNRWYKRLPD